MMGIGYRCGSGKREHIDFVAYSRKIFDPAIHDPVDPIQADDVNYIR